MAGLESWFYDNIALLNDFTSGGINKNAFF